MNTNKVTEVTVDSTRHDAAFVASMTLEQFLAYGKEKNLHGEWLPEVQEQKLREVHEKALAAVGQKPAPAPEPAKKAKPNQGA